MSINKHNLIQTEVFTIQLPHTRVKKYSTPSRDSPFNTEEDSLFMMTTPPPRRCIAAANDPEV